MLGIATLSFLSPCLIVTCDAEVDENAPRGVVFDRARSRWAIKIAGKRYGRFANKNVAMAMCNMHLKFLQPSAPLYTIPDDADFNVAEATVPEANIVLSSRVKVWSFACKVLG